MNKQVIQFIIGRLIHTINIVFMDWQIPDYIRVYKKLTKWIYSAVN